MAAPSKKRAVEQNMEDLELENSDEEESHDEEESEEEPMNEEIQVDFEARNAEDSDYGGIRKLLHQLFLKANINISEMADTILGQNYIGCVIQQCEVSEEEASDDGSEADIFGVMSAINLTDKKALDFVKEMTHFLLDKCAQKSPKHRQPLFDLLRDENNPLGFIINERFINIPPQIALPSFDHLWKGLEKANQKKMKYNFKHYLLISKTYQMPEVSKKKKKNKPQEYSSGQLVFVNQEEEFFFEESSLSFNYSVAAERDKGVSGTWGDSSEEMEPLRTVMIIPAEKIPVIMTKLRDVLS